MNLCSLNKKFQITKELSIPLREIKFRFSSSSGPGGQNVNRVATRVQLRYDVARSPSLGELERRRILSELKPNIDRRGVFQLVSQRTRSQRRNREEALERFQRAVRNALRPYRERRPTKTPARAKRRRLEEKRKRRDTKRLRRSPCLSREE